jgi:hypothetical protein
MGIFSDRNLYAGVNPHLNSFLQNPPSRWEMFHSAHIIHLSEYLDRELPEGYGCAAEKSLQISMTPRWSHKPSWTKADVVITADPTLQIRPKFQKSPAPVAEFDLIELADIDDEEETLNAIVIYQINLKDLPGSPVTRIELISPANKYSGAHYSQYQRKKYQSLKAGLNLVEVDYLHQFPPLANSLPDYRQYEENAYPFIVIVSNPHPAYEMGKAQIFGAFVDTLMPPIPVPLLDDDNILFDLNKPYDYTFASNRLFHHFIDYSQLPLAFERYSPADQERIKARMAAVAVEVVP